jgi:hypothetical protein
MAVATGKASAARATNPHASRGSDLDKLRKELKDTREQLDDVRLRQRANLVVSYASQITLSRDSFQKQLEDLVKVRHTEAEKLRDHQREEYEARIKSSSLSLCQTVVGNLSPAQEQLISELTNQLARVDKLTRGNKFSTLKFITRDAADEEKRVVEREVARLRDLDKAKDATIVSRDQHIAKLEQQGMFSVLFA